MEQKELCQWLRDNSAGTYRPSAQAADEIERCHRELNQKAAALKRLVKRFNAMAGVCERHALEKRQARAHYASYASIAGLEAAADAYRRCAEEVSRVANGEMPPEPNLRWEPEESPNG